MVSDNNAVRGKRENWSRNIGVPKSKQAAENEIWELNKYKHKGIYVDDLIGLMEDLISSLVAKEKEEVTTLVSSVATAADVPTNGKGGGKGPCRDGAACTRPGCWFDHPGSITPVSSGAPSADDLINGKGGGKGLCRDGAACTRPGCWFDHPGSITPASTGAPSADDLTHGKGGGRGPCRDGSAATRPRGSYHPGSITSTSSVAPSADEVARGKGGGKGPCRNGAAIQKLQSTVSGCLEQSQLEVQDKYEKASHLLRKSNEDKRAEGKLKQTEASVREQQLHEFKVTIGGILDELGLQSDNDSRDAKGLRRWANRELHRFKAGLPALSHRKEIVTALRSHQCLVIRGQTGSGKSTQVPQYLADTADICSQGTTDDLPDQIICTQPRKVAAVALATRVAEEWAAGYKPKFGAPSLVGGCVGYMVGGEKRVSKRTVIVYMTEAALLQRLLERPQDVLDKRVQAVILDEAHERSVTLDLLLGMLVRLQRTQPKYQHLRIVVTSATLDVDLFSKYLGNCPIVEIPGRMYPVKDVYYPAEGVELSMINRVVDVAYQLHVDHEIWAGDILAFLPGQKDVEEAKIMFESKLNKSGKVNTATGMCLYGKQEPEDQRAVFEPAAHGRKVVFSTDVAETSVTIDGVRFIIDSGLGKKLVFNSKRNMSSLEEMAISKSSAQQRRGRAGRTAPGTCIRLYSQDSFDAMQETQTAEVLSQPADKTIVQLLALGQDPFQFPWLERPNDSAMATALRSLSFLGAVEGSQENLVLTPFGDFASRLEISISWAKALHLGCQQGLSQTAVDLVALMSVAQMVFLRREEGPSEHLKRSFDPQGDLMTLYELYSKWSQIRQGQGGAVNDADHDTPKPSAPTDQKCAEHMRRTSENHANGHDEEDIGSDLTEEQKAELELQRERQMLLVSGNKAAKSFCQQMGLSFRALCIASRASFDFKRSLKTMGVWTEQLHEPAEHDVLKLVLAASLPNIAIRVGGHCSRFASFRVVDIGSATEMATAVGTLFPSSVILQAEAEDVSNICFLSMLQTSRLFLHNATVLPSDEAGLLNLVYAVSPLLAEHLAGVLPSFTSSCVQVDGFTSSMLIGQSAKRRMHGMQEAFACSLLPDPQNGMVVAWCRKHQSDTVGQALTSLRENLRRENQMEILEEELGGGTRVLYGCGGEVMDILYPPEFISVNISGLAADTDETCFQAEMELYGKVRSVTVHGCGASRTLGSIGLASFGQAIFEQKQDARTAQAEYPRLAQTAVNAFPGGIRNLTAECDITEHLQMLWEVAVHPVPCRWGDACTRKESCKFSHAPQAPLRSDEPSLSVLVAGLRQLIPMPELEPEVETFFFRKSVRDKGIVDFGGFHIRYPRADVVQEAMQQWQVIRGDAHITEGVEQRLLDSICLQATCECTISLDRELYKWFAESVEWQSAVKNAKSNGVNVTEKKTEVRKKAMIFLKHSMRSPLIRARDAFMEVLTPSIFKHPRKSLLFNPVGKKRMMDISDDLKVAYVHWDHRTQTVRLYGPQASRQAALEILEALVSRLQEVHFDSVVLTRDGSQGLRDEHVKETFQEVCQLEEVQLRRGLLSMWGTEESLSQARTWLSTWIKQMRTPNGNQDEECPICFCEFDPQVFQLQGCGHKFCEECIRNSISDPDGAHHPIVCPKQGCGMPWVWRDIVSLARPEILERIKVIACAQFALKHKETICDCPTPGCGNLLAKDFPKPDTAHAQAAIGGWPLHCSSCGMRYCKACSEACDKLMPLHLGDSCADNRANARKDVRDHRSHIVNQLMTLRCPRCDKAFLDYSGCAALKCSCGCSFCACCLKDCGEDAHDHVRSCSDNPCQGDFFVTEVQFHNLHRDKAQKQVTSYLNTIHDLQLRSEVIRACRIDFKEYPGGGIHV